MIYLLLGGLGDLVSIKSKTLSLKIKEIFLAELVYTPALNSQRVSNEERFMKRSCCDFTRPCGQFWFYWLSSEQRLFPVEMEENVAVYVLRSHNCPRFNVATYGDHVKGHLFKQKHGTS